MKRIALNLKEFFIGMAFIVMNVLPAFAQNVTFNSYWELPDSNILLVKERLYFFIQTDGKLTGGTGCFYYTNNQLIFQNPNFGKIPFTYTGIDSGSIRVTDAGGENAWAQGVWKKRTNVPGTTVKHPLIGYWEGKTGDTTWILYIAGNDIVPAFDLKWFAEELDGQLVPQDGWAYEFDRENNLKNIYPLYFRENFGIFLGNAPGYDGLGRPYRFDGNILIINHYYWDNKEIRFVRK